ncbi:MAG: glycosyltransferase family 4 protein [Paracoccaceae bacterium]
MTDRPKVLVMAEAANPEWVSVPLVGWSMAQALREVADVHLVTQIRNREAILRAGLVEGRDFTAIDSEAFAEPLWKLGTKLAGGSGQGWTIQQAVATLAYPYFERLVWKRFGAAIRAGEYDIVHRVTPLSPIQQSPIAAKCRRAGVPFVVGPINGGVPWPKGFEAEMRNERERLSKLRSLYKLLPGRGATLRNASAILVGGRFTEREMPDRVRDKVIYIPENAIDPARFWRQAVPAEPGKLRACFIGRLVPLKGVDMLLEAAAPLLSDGQLHLDIIGDGPMMGPLTAQADALGLGDSVTFHGWVAHEDIQDILAQSQLLAFPSIREFGGGVVLEAMALGLAPMVMDYAGPAELVGENAGYLIPMTDRAGVVAALRTTLAHCTANTEEVAAVGARAKARIDGLFTWSAKARQIAEVYDWLRHPGRPKPGFAF